MIPDCYEKCKKCFQDWVKFAELQRLELWFNLTYNFLQAINIYILSSTRHLISAGYNTLTF